MVSSQRIFIVRIVISFNIKENNSALQNPWILYFTMADILSGSWVNKHVFARSVMIINTL